MKDKTRWFWKSLFYTPIYPYNEAWDKQLSDLLDKHVFEPRITSWGRSGMEDYTCMLGDVEIWVSHPVRAEVSFRPYREENNGFRASKITIARALEKYRKESKDFEVKRQAANLTLAGWTNAPNTALVPMQTPTPNTAQAQAAAQAIINSWTPATTTTPLGLLEKLQRDIAVLNKKIGALSSAEVVKPKPRIPDYVHTLVGWRGWRVDDGYLYALGLDGYWEPKVKECAVCKADKFAMTKTGVKHLAPNKDCNCGYWSFKTFDLMQSAIKNYANVITVVGSVEIWGKVIDCENGYRSEFAYPKELWLLEPNLEYLGEMYGVPIRVIHTQYEDFK